MANKKVIHLFGRLNTPSISQLCFCLFVQLSLFFCFPEKCRLEIKLPYCEKCNRDKWSLYVPETKPLVQPSLEDSA